MKSGYGYYWTWTQKIDQCPVGMPRFIEEDRFETSFCNSSAGYYYFLLYPRINFYDFVVYFQPKLPG